MIYSVIKGIYVSVNLGTTKVRILGVIMIVSFLLELIKDVFIIIGNSEGMNRDVVRPDFEAIFISGEDEKLLSSLALFTKNIERDQGRMIILVIISFEIVTNSEEKGARLENMKISLN